MTRLPMAPQRMIDLTIDAAKVRVPEGSTLLDACQASGLTVPTLCWARNLTPVNACRLCVVEVDGARALAPACSRPVEEGMVVHTDSERVRLARRLVLEWLASSVDLSTAPGIDGLLARYGAIPERFGPEAAAVAEPLRVDNELYIRDYAKCILCYKCVEACGADAQNTFAIAASGRGFEARISTELDVALPDSACVYCGNCIDVCPTGALMFKTERDLREAGAWDESKQTTTDTVCSYCGVGCVLSLHVQDGRIVKVGSPDDSAVSGGNLCVKGRFGWRFVQGQ